MNPAPTMQAWGEILIALAAGGAGMVVLGHIFSRLIRTARWQRAIWQACIVGLAALLVAELTGLTGSAGNWLSMARVANEASVVIVKEPAAEQGTSVEQASQEIGRLDTLVRPAEATSVLPIMATSEPIRLVESTPDKSVLPIEEPEPIGSPSAVTSETSQTWWPGLLWIAVSVVLVGRLAVANVMLAWFRHKCSRANLRRHLPPELVSRVASLSQRLGFRRQVRILQSDGLMSPAAFGLFWPTIVLPPGFTVDCDSSKQEAVLAHELAHLAGRDPCWHLFADVVTAAWWWHPLAWWARHQLRAANEAVADEASLVVADGPGVLAACLVEMGKRLAHAPRAGWVPVEGNGFRSSLGRRVERLLKLAGAGQGGWCRPSRLRFAFVISLGAVALLAAAIFSTAWARTQAISEGDPSMKTIVSSWKRSLAGMVFVAVVGSSVEAPVVAGPPKEAGKPLYDQATEKQKSGQTTQPGAVGFFQPARQPAPPKDVPGRGPQGGVSRPGFNPAAMMMPMMGPGGGAPAERTLALKVFRLKHTDPDSVQKILQSLLEQPPADPGARWRGMAGMPGGMRGPGGGAGPMPMMPGAFRPPDAGYLVTSPLFLQGSHGWRIVTEPRTRSMIVRGYDDDLQIASDVVAVLDLPADKPKPKVKSLRAFQLRSTDAENALQVLQVLGINARMVGVPDSNTFIVAGPDLAMKQAEKIIAAFNAQPDKAVPEVEGLRTFKLQHADANNVANVLGALDFNARIAPVPKLKLILASGSDEAMKKIAEVIEALDVDGKTPARFEE